MNDNQLVILEWLKDEYVDLTYYPMALVGTLLSDLPFELNEAFNSLTRYEEFEVVQAFASWGLEFGEI